MKVLCQDMEGKPTIFVANLGEAKRIKKLILKEILVSVVGVERDTEHVRTYDLDPCKDEVRTIPNCKFEFIQLGDDLSGQLR